MFVCSSLFEIDRLFPGASSLATSQNRLDFRFRFRRRLFRRECSSSFGQVVRSQELSVPEVSFAVFGLDQVGSSVSLFNDDAGKVPTSCSPVLDQDFFANVEAGLRARRSSFLCFPSLLPPDNFSLFEIMV